MKLVHVFRAVAVAGTAACAILCTTIAAPAARRSPITPLKASPTAAPSPAP